MKTFALIALLLPLSACVKLGEVKHITVLPKVQTARELPVVIEDTPNVRADVLGVSTYSEDNIKVEMTFTNRGHTTVSYVELRCDLLDAHQIKIGRNMTNALELEPGQLSSNWMVVPYRGSPASLHCRVVER